MPSVKPPAISAAEGDKFPVLGTRLAQVEPIVRPKVGRRPPGLVKPPPVTIKPVAFGSKKPAPENTGTPAGKPAPAGKRRALTPAFIAVLVGVALVMNFTFTRLLGHKPDAASVAEKSAIILGAPAPAPKPPAPAAAQGEVVEVIPYHRSYDAELIQKLEDQNSPAAGAAN